MTPTPTISRPDTADVKAMAERLRNLPTFIDPRFLDTEKTIGIANAAADLLDRLSAHPSAGPAVREALAREEKYLIDGLLDENCGLMPGDIQGSFHRIREALSAPSGPSVEDDVQRRIADGRQCNEQSAQSLSLASGCCSSVTPCNHQKQSPYTICETCKTAGEYRHGTDATSNWSI